jgi:hypothetical protein
MAERRDEQALGIHAIQTQLERQVVGQRGNAQAVTIERRTLVARDRQLDEQGGREIQLLQGLVDCPGLGGTGQHPLPSGVLVHKGGGLASQFH